MNRILHSVYFSVLSLLLLFQWLTMPVYSQKFGNSYVNVTKKTVGGTVEPGDILEIRTNYYFTNTYNGGNIYFIRYVDNVPTNTTYSPTFLKLITNEGLNFLTYTDAVTDDRGSYKATPPVGEYNIRINIGTGAANIVNNTTTTTGGGSYALASQQPRVGGGMLLTTSFRVQVTGNYGDIITLGAGRLYYKKSNSSGAVDTIVNATRYQIMISRNDPVCPNSVGKNFAAEAGGTFDSGTTQNRGYGPSFLIPTYTYRNLTYSNQINDGFYTIVNNLSPSGSTFINAEKRPTCPTAYSATPPPAPPVLACANRMFGGHWEIIGDHTGSTTSAGNPPALAGTNGGYMLVVNADYVTTEAYRQNITGLCPSTSYEFSLWVRNVCSNCGIDVAGTQKYDNGVFPNLTFTIDGFDRYSSGEVPSASGWVKKGFLFQTGPAQTSITISIRNNASGGGGNDWAIDDIALTTCNPNLDLQPSGTANVCYGNQVDMSCLVRSYFPNYTYWSWEKSTDGGLTWLSTGQSGIGSPTLVTGNYEYTTTYPPIIGDSTSHNNLYRIKVATSAANLLDNNCSFATNTIIQVFVNNCRWLLNTDILNVTGALKNNYPQLQWTTVDETVGVKYTLQKSYDKLNFEDLASFEGTIPGGKGNYQYNEPKILNTTAYYRIKISMGAEFKYSKTILLTPEKLTFQVNNLVNPFNNILSFDIVSPADGNAQIIVMDNYGRLLRNQQQQFSKGLTTVKITNTGDISSGIYTLRVQWKDQVISKRIIKMDK